jgi:glutamate racemase
MNNAPIGVFDSGIGGLTVVKAIMDIIPDESIIYFGDLVHLPYGNKSEKAIKDFSISNTKFLLNKNVKMIVVACNSASSIALEEIKNHTDLPVIGVVFPGAENAVNNSKSMNIGVIGTTRTIASGSYETAIKKIKPDANVYQKSTPLLVPLIEENWIDKLATRLVIREYVDYFKNGKHIDALVLGCTHYPLIKNVIEQEFTGVKVIDSARSTAFKVKQILEKKNIAAQKSNVKHEFFVNDITEGFKQLAYRIIGKKIKITNICENGEN